MWTEPTGGWWVGEVNGEPWFTDGHAMFIGKRSGRELDQLQSGFDKYAKGGVLLPAIITGAEVIKTSDGECFAVLILNRQTAIQSKFYSYAIETFPAAEIYLGPIAEHEERVIIFKAKGKIVGCVMPVRL